MRFVVDASFTLWRRGARRRAAVVGGTITFFCLVGGVQAALVDAGIMRTPYLLSFAYLAILIAMGIELSNDVLSAAQLAPDLRESEARMTLAAEAAGFGVWMWSIATQPGLGLGEVAPSVRVRTRCGPLVLKRSSSESIRTTARRWCARCGARWRTGPITRGNTACFCPTAPSAGSRPGAGCIRTRTGSRPECWARRSMSPGANRRNRSSPQQRNEVAHLSRVTTLGEISGSLAHELNQPLCAMLVNTDSAQLHLQSPTPNLDEVRAILADIRKDGLRAGEIIHGMRAFLRRKELDTQPLEVGQLAGDAVKLISADAVARKTTVGLEIPPGLPRVTGDRVHLQQVLINLLVNGMDAMCNCPVADRRITIRATQPDPHTVEIAVSDVGVGIPPGDLDRVFTPFHTTKHGGLGLGLPICRSIVEAHGGSISIKNNPDRGATARFSLPACVEGEA